MKTEESEITEFSEKTFLLLKKRMEKYLENLSWFFESQIFDPDLWRKIDESSKKIAIRKEKPLVLTYPWKTLFNIQI